MRATKDVIKHAEQLEKEGKLNPIHTYVEPVEIGVFIEVKKINGKWQKVNE